MFAATTIERARLVPACRLQCPQAIGFGPARAARFAVDARGFCQVLLTVFVPLDVLEKLREHTVPAVRAGERCAALVRLRIARFDPAPSLDGRRAHADR